MSNRKLSRPTDQRMAILRNLTTALIWNDRIVTTQARAKEVRSMAEKMITLAVQEHKNTVEVSKKIKNDKGDFEVQTVINDMPSKLNARRKMLSTIYNITDSRKDDESKYDYKKRLDEMPNFPVVEKLFREIGPKYESRPGGYTRIIKMGPRRGDAAEMVILELV